MSSDHGLEDEQIRTLNQIVKWVAEVYFHLFYKIKGQWKTIYGPHHLLTLLRLYKKQDPVVRERVAPYIKSEAWWAHSKSILVSLLCSSDNVERNFGVSQIIKIRERAMGQKGRERVRERKVPSTFNIEATSLIKLIDWEKENVTEPVFTAHLSAEELMAFRAVPMEEPNYPLHTQSCDRTVKQVTEASASLCGWEIRDGFVRARIANRELMPVYRSRKDLVPMFDKM